MWCGASLTVMSQNYIHEEIKKKKKLTWGIASSHSLQNLFSSHVTSVNVKIKI
jgi:hypothetical protein